MLFKLKQQQLETVSIAEPLQNRQHAPLMLSTVLTALGVHAAGFLAP